MTMKNDSFSYICKMVRERAAIVLDEGKEYLVDSRLTPVARQEGLASIDELVAQLRHGPFTSLHQKVIEAMTTNETSFFRDVHPFEALKKVIIPDLMEKRAAEHTLHFWCAATSSGQEPYSIAILLREYFPVLQQWTIRFVGSDISNEMLERTRAGCYSQLEVNRGLPAPLLVKYFQKQGLAWQVKDDLRRMFEFHQVNLAAAWPAMPKMDIVFMRNVLIYFDMATKKAILGKVRQLLRPDGGYLFLGGAETTMNIDDGFERVQLDKTSCYRLRAT